MMIFSQSSVSETSVITLVSRYVSHNGLERVKYVVSDDVYFLQPLASCSMFVCIVRKIIYVHVIASTLICCY